MVNLKERKKQLFSIIDNYDVFLGRNENDEYKKRREWLDLQKEIIDRSRYQIAIIGFVKNGKSTLLNAMLGTHGSHDLSPVSIVPCTGAIVKYKDSALHPDGKGEGAFIHYNDRKYDDGKKSIESIALEEIPKYVDQDNPGFKKDRAERIDHIEVYGDFPLIETRGIIVDTPGLGALYDQDYLAKSILQEVDVILCPISVNSFTKGEKEFLESLSEREKEKLTFVITMIDLTRTEEDLSKVVSYAQKHIEPILGKMPHLYQVAARMILDAYEAGESPEEIEKVKKEWGMKELEDAIDKMLRSRSIADNNLRGVCKELDTYFANDKNRYNAIREDFNLTSTALEAKKKELENFRSKITRDFEEGLRELEVKWQDAVKDFMDNKVYEKRGAISERLVSEVEKGKLKDLMNYSAKLNRKIQDILQTELKDELSDFEKLLRAIVQDIAIKLDTKIKENIRLYAKFDPENEMGNKVGAMIGTGVAGGGAVVGTTAIVGSLASIASAATGVTVASAELATIMASGGVFAKVGVALGIGKASAATGALAAAEGALSVALGAAVFPVLAGAVVIAGAYKIGTHIARAKTSKQIPEIVGLQLQDIALPIERTSKEMYENVVLRFQGNLKAILDTAKADLEDVQKQDDDLKRKVKIEAIENAIEELGKLKSELTPFMNSLEV